METVIREAVRDALDELGYGEVDFSVEHPKELARGDYASNAAMVVAKEAGKAPQEVAEQLLAALENTIEYVERIEVAGPGFINFYLDRSFFQKEVGRAVDLGERWGQNDSWESKKVIVEYTDPNPFKEFHIGHLFTNIVGESIARLFMAAGAEVRRVNYQGDIGLHVACAVWGMQELGFAGARDVSSGELGKAYALGATAYKEDEKAAEEIKTLNRLLYERSDEVVNALYDKGRAASLAYFETIYEILDTKFDHHFFESETAPRGKEIVLTHPDIFTESDGARVFEGEKYGLHTRVFLNSEGLPTYEAKELALAEMKYEYFPYEHSVVSTANEISEYFKVLIRALGSINPELAEKTEHIGHGMIRLAEGKMSSRTGKVIPAIDFIDELKTAVRKKIEESPTTSDEVDEEIATNIAVGAVKYTTLKSSIFQDSVFNKEQALSFEGDSGPYLQYTHARIGSVLEKAKKEGIKSSVKTVPATPYEIEKLLYRFPEVVQKALDERAPHYVATFLTELAGSFNSFYAKETIADATDEYAPYKAMLAAAVRQTLKNGLWLLGIKAPERM